MSPFSLFLPILLLENVNPFSSPMDRIYPDTLSELLEQSKSTKNAIYGNPLLYPKCSNALIDQHSENMKFILSKSGIPTPWFWSRETIDATIKNKSLHRRLKVTSKHAPIALIPWSAHAAYAFGRSHSFLPHHMVRWFERLGNVTQRSSDFALSNAQKLQLMIDKRGYMASLPASAHYYRMSTECFECFVQFAIATRRHRKVWLLLNGRHTWQIWRL